MTLEELLKILIASENGKSLVTRVDPETNVEILGDYGWESVGFVEYDVVRNTIRLRRCQPDWDKTVEVRVFPGIDKFASITDMESE